MRFLIDSLSYLFPGEPIEQGPLRRDQSGTRIRRLHLRPRHPPPCRRQLHRIKRKYRYYRISRIIAFKRNHFVSNQFITTKTIKCSSFNSLP